MTPSEFWRCDPVELWWIVEARRPQKTYGDMSEAEVSEIYEEAYGHGVG